MQLAGEPVRTDRTRSRLRPSRMLALGTAGALVLSGAVALPAHAAPGDTSRATGQYLAGSLLSLNATLVASLGGEVAQSTGTATDTQGPNDLNIGLLGVVNLELPGGIQVPIDLGDVGTVAQYAQARPDASATGASGLITDTGAIGVIGEDDAPGPLSLSLGGVVSSLSPTLGAAVTDQLADLALTVGVTAATASQAPPAAPTGDYALADASLSFRSPAIAGLAGAINTQVAGVQAIVDGLEGLIEAALLGGINLPGVLAANADVDGVDLSALVSPLLTAPLTDPAYPGVTLNLSTGVVTIDLAEITTLEGLAPNTDLLTAAVVNNITSSISGLVTALLSEVEQTLEEATDALIVEASVTLGLSPIVEVEATVGELLAGDTSGIELLGLGLTLPGGLGFVLGLILTPLNTLSTAISGITAVVLAPVTNALVPAVKPVLDAAVGLTVNNQSTTGGVFTETALRAEVLPGLNALQLDIANASVGPNAVATTITSIAPSTGPVTGGTVVVITGTGFTDATGVTFGGTAGTSFTVDSDTQITVTTPPGTEGDVDVVVQSPAGDSSPATFTYTAVAAPEVTSVSPAFGPTAGGTVVTITGSGLTGATAPPSGPLAGGTEVTITGTDFTGATGVTFDGAAGTVFTVVSDTEITVTTPAGSAGPADVVVLSPNGASTPGTFTYLAPPVIDGISPATGPVSGGTEVTITGSGFTGATGVTFDGVPGTGFTVIDDTTIRVTTPPGTAGTADVVIVSPMGNSTAAAFTYVAEGGGAGGGTGGGDDLPVTGGDLGGMALLALLALLPLTAGVALMRRARRMAA